MIHDNLCWIFESAFNKKECNHIIKIIDNSKKTKAKTHGKTSSKQRKGKVVWKNPEYFKNLIEPLFNQANNNAGWNYQYDLLEEIQLAQYDINDHFNWHEDTLSKPFKGNKIRKLSMSINLSDPSSYEGGDFIFRRLIKGEVNDFQPIKFKRQGSVVIFPSPTMHKVNPVTKGTRYALVAWALGDPFK
jgi:PKHD-type hydroxylase